MYNIPSIENFVDTVVEALKERYPQCEVFARQTLKNNGVRLHSVIVRQHEEVVPEIHLDWYYAAYCTGEANCPDEDKIIHDCLGEAKDFAKEVSKYLYEIKKQRPLTETERELLDKTHDVHVHTNDSRMLIQKQHPDIC